MGSQTTYHPSEIATLIENSGKSKSTFYRLVRKGTIRKKVAGNEEVYDGPTVEAFLRGELLEDDRRKKKTSNLEHLETDWITADDLVRLYVFDVEAHGMDRAIEATTMRAWYHQNPFLTRILYNSSNRSQILGAITILPLSEQIILQVLQGKLTEREIALKDISYYQSGKTYIGYIAFAAVNSQYKEHFLSLLQSFFDFWCKVPNLSITKLYTVTTTPEWDETIGRLYFAPRYDLKHHIVDNQPYRTDAYELDLRRSNFSPIVKEIQKAMNLLTPSSPADTELIASIQMLSKTPDDATDLITFEKARREDLKACYAIDMDLYGLGESNPVGVREARFDKVPDGFYVLRHQGQIIAHTSFLPVDPSELRRIRAGIPGRIPMEKISNFVIGKPLDIYFVILSTRQPDPGRRYALRLLAGLMHVFRQLGAQGVNIQHIFAFSRTTDGIRICEELGMSKEAFEGDPDRYMFAMNVQTGAPKIAREYQAGLAEYRAEQKEKEY